jgi:hypothetical protein
MLPLASSVFLRYFWLGGSSPVSLVRRLPSGRMQLPLIASPTPPPPPPLEMIGSQGDIRYYDQPAKGVLNTPESTGMPFWSINPYVGCAFGCAYCYARYAHRYVAERKMAAGADDDQVLAELPPWLAFERRIFVKRNAAEVLRESLTGHRPETAIRSRKSGVDSQAPGPRPRPGLTSSGKARRSSSARPPIPTSRPNASSA